MTGYTMFSNKIYDLPLDIYEKSILIYVSRFINSPHKCFASYATIARNCSMSRRQAIYSVKALVHAKHLKSTSQGIKKPCILEISPELVHSMHQIAKTEPKLVHSVHQTSAPHAPEIVHSVHPSIKTIIKNKNARAEDEQPMTEEQRKENLLKLQQMIGGALKHVKPKT